VQVYELQALTLTCHTTLDEPVDWRYYKTSSSYPDRIADRGSVVDGMNDKFALDTEVKGDYNLIIKQIMLMDAGLYMCIENSGFGPGIGSVQVMVLGE
jgi:hypothetical protein